MLGTLLLVMRFPRVKAEGQGFYHCISRVVEGRFIFGFSGARGLEAERFIALHAPSGGFQRCPGPDLRPDG
jgi:hypothetical protein